MLRYITKRVLLIIPTLLVVIFIIFAILNITPGDPGRIILGVDASQEAVDDLNRELGVDRPMLERFGRYILDALRLDFGESYRSREPVFNEILRKFPTTLKLAVASLVVMTLVGIPLGIISAVRQYSVLDYSLTVSSLILASMPSFFLALLLIMLFSVVLGILPSSGIGTPAHYVLPVITLALPSAAFLARMTRTSMLETMRQDYIRTARAKGASKERVITRHALKAALLPVLPVLGMNFAATLGGALITEVVFGLPGIGSIIQTATQMKDTPVILACALLLAVIFKVTMLFVDVLQALIDPRLKAQFR